MSDDANRGQIDPHRDIAASSFVWTLHEVEDGEGNGVIHWYCSPICRDNEATDYGEVGPIRLDQPAPDGAICETCGVDL